MAKKKKKSAKKRETHDLFKGMSTAQLLEQGQHYLKGEKPREALSCFKQAGKQDGFTATIKNLMFKAYLVRAGQLRAKGLQVEAESMMQLATDFMPSAQDITEKDLLPYVQQAAPDQAMKIYAAWLNTHPLSSACENQLADRLVESRQWNLVESLPEASGLKDNIDCIRNAVEAMDQGEWEKALNTLKPVSSRSPFAPWRLFCRGMTAFLKDDDKSMQKAFSLIPAGFSLMPVIDSMRMPLKTLLADRPDSSPAILDCFWEGPIKKEKYITELFQTLKQRRFSQIKTAIVQLAEMISPQEPLSSKIFILKYVWLYLMMQMDTSPEPFFKLLHQLLPRDIADLLTDNMQLLAGIAPFSASGSNISSLDQIFKDETQQSMAKSLILFKLLERVTDTPEWFDRDRAGLESFRALLGISATHLETDDREMILLDIAAEALRLDPDNKAGCRQIVRLKHHSRAAKTRLEALLQTMVERFADDPWPCLELASVYYEKNAFRKAESILSEAMQRAPHDRQVLERHVIALLISIKNNLRRHKYNPAWKDLERAEAYSSPGTAPLIAEKKILLQMLDRQQPLEAALEAALAPFETADQLKIMVLLAMEMETGKLDFSGSIRKQLDTRLVKSMKNIKKLSSMEIMQLLLPIRKEYTPLIDSRFLFDSTAIKKYKLLSYLNHADFSRILISVIDETLFPVIQKEIKKRLKSDVRPDDRIRLQFYQVVIKNIDRPFCDLSAIDRIVQQAKGELREDLRRIARTLADFVYPFHPLHSALERFDFSETHPFFDDDIDEMWDEEEEMWDEEGEVGIEDFDHFMDILVSMLAQLRELTPRTRLNHLKAFVQSVEASAQATSSLDFDKLNHLKAFIEDFLDFPNLDQKLKIAAQLIERHQSLQLSPRASHFLFGK
jgi:tetratricopeptide (TPR) repeat protein